MSRDSMPAGVVYKEVPGFPGYLVGDDGSVWTCRRRKGGRDPKERGKFIFSDQWKRMGARPINSGYLMVCLTKDGKEYQMLLQHIVLLAFVGPRPEGMQARHFPDRTRTNCRADNLQWGTRKENEADKIKDGTSQHGERNCRVKLKTEQVIEIRKRVSEGANRQSLAAYYGVSKATVGDIVTRKSWFHLP